MITVYPSKKFNGYFTAFAFEKQFFAPVLKATLTLAAHAWNPQPHKR